MTEELLREGDIVRIGSTQLVLNPPRKPKPRRRAAIRRRQGIQDLARIKSRRPLRADSGTSQREGEHFARSASRFKWIQSEKDEDKLFAKILDTIEEYIPADNIYIFLKDEQSGAISRAQLARRVPTPVSRSRVRSCAASLRNLARF